MQPHRRRAARAVQEQSELTQIKALPRAQQDDLAIPRAQPPKRNGEELRGRIVCPCRSCGAPQARHQRLRPDGAAPLISQYPARAPQKPRQCLIRNILKPPTCHHEHLHQDILGHPRNSTPPGVRMNRVRVREVQRFQALTTLINVHAYMMSGNSAGFTPAPPLQWTAASID